MHSASFGVIAALSAVTVTHAADFPTRPVRFVLGFPAGGPTDAAGRIIAQALQAPLGQSVVVDNRPGR
jgi:tripartite-type tricarboxylate transporter receptor subunit TctC